MKALMGNGCLYVAKEERISSDLERLSAKLTIVRLVIVSVVISK